MDPYTKLGNCLNKDTYPEILSILDKAGEYIRNLKEDKALIMDRARNENENMKIQLGILHFLLMDRYQFQFDFKDLVDISRDNLDKCSNYIWSIISENWMNIKPYVKLNVISILIDFLSFPMAELLFRTIFKRMTTGDLSPDNLWLIENMLTLIEDHKERIVKDSKLLPLIVYTYLRLIPTHYQRSYVNNAPSNNLARLCKKEIALVMDILRTNFDDCLRCGGRDMLFMLNQNSNEPELESSWLQMYYNINPHLDVVEMPKQDSEIPEFEALWSDMWHKMHTLSAYFRDVEEILSLRTDEKMIATAIPCDMELSILWIMRNVNYDIASQELDLFNERFFSTPESEYLRSYLIRFIIRCFCPNNEMIASTLISRWAIISWLLMKASTQTVGENCKMAFIYDWLFYDVNYDDIMDIEPAILAIMHNLTEYPDVSFTLIDFLLKTVYSYHPNFRDKVAASVRLGLNLALRLEVFSSLKPMMDMLRNRSPIFTEFITLGLDIFDILPSQEPAFDYNVKRIQVPSVLSRIYSSITTDLKNLYDSASGASSDEEIQNMIVKMEEMVASILNHVSFDDLGIAEMTAAVLCEVCYPYFDKKLLPDLSEEEKQKVLRSSPVFVIFKNICTMRTQDNKRGWLLLSKMLMRQPRVGYFLLYYIKLAKIVDPDLSIYRRLCNSLEKPNLENSLYKDIKLLSKDDSRLMVFLLPDLYSAFSAEMRGSAEFAHLFISKLDAAKMKFLVIDIHKNNFVMFDPNSVVDVLKASLEWGTIEQYFLWDLLLCHNIAPKYFYGLIPFLDFEKNPVAISRFSNFLRQDRPCQELIRLLLNREVEEGDEFTATLLHFWSSDKNSTSSEFVKILHGILSSSLRNDSEDQKENKHSQVSDEASVVLVKILSHLHFMKLHYKDISFLQEESIQSDLAKVLTLKFMSYDIKAQFSKLLAIKDEKKVDEVAANEHTLKNLNLFTKVAD